MWSRKVRSITASGTKLIVNGLEVKQNGLEVTICKVTIDKEPSLCKIGQRSEDTVTGITRRGTTALQVQTDAPTRGVDPPARKHPCWSTSKPQLHIAGPSII